MTIELGLGITWFIIGVIIAEIGLLYDVKRELRFGGYVCIIAFWPFIVPLAGILVLLGKKEK